MSINPYKRLRGLLADDATHVGEVTTVNSNGTSVVTLVGGGNVTVSGDSFSVGDNVFIKNDEIISGAPSLTSTEIEV